MASFSGLLQPSTRVLTSQFPPSDPIILKSGPPHALSPSARVVPPTRVTVFTYLPSSFRKQFHITFLASPVGGLPTGAVLTGEPPTGGLLIGEVPTGGLTGGPPTGGLTGGPPTGGPPTGGLTGGPPPTGAVTGGPPTGAVTGAPPTGAPPGAASDNIAVGSKSPRPAEAPTVPVVLFKPRLPPRI